MKKTRIMTVLVLAFALSLAFTLSNNAQDAGKYSYIGNKKCKMCHSAPKKGAQFKSWEDSKHSKAFATLATAEAKAAGAKLGVTDPQKDPKCLKCHVTGYGLDSKLTEKYVAEDGVGCESCHGAGEKYNSKPVMEALSKGTTEPASVGLVIPTEATCKTCHNEGSPTFKGFNYAEKLKVINHMMPEDYRKEMGYKAKK